VIPWIALCMAGGGGRYRVGRVAAAGDGYKLKSSPR